MVLQQLLRPLWLSAVSILLVDRHLHRFHDVVARCFSLDDYIHCSPYVSLQSKGTNHLFDIALGSRSV